MSDEIPRVRFQLEQQGTLLHVLLDRPKGNVLDVAAIDAIRAIVRANEGRRGLRTILFEGAGPDFSFGVSIEDHRADRVATMLAQFHALFRELHATGRVLLAAVRKFTAVA